MFVFVYGNYNSNLTLLGADVCLVRVSRVHCLLHVRTTTPAGLYLLLYEHYLYRLHLY